jgi:hypothetical protein
VRKLFGVGKGHGAFAKHAVPNAWVAVLSLIALTAPAAATAATAPVVERVRTARLSSTDATLTAKINAGGLETTYEFEVWRTCPEHFSTETTCELIQLVLQSGGALPASSVGRGVSLKLGRAGVTLAPGSEYIYSVSATNALGTGHSASQDFEAPFPALPAIYWESVSRVTAESARISARINTEGSEGEYEIWLWPGCKEGGCERVPPRLVAAGHLPASTSAQSVSAKVSAVPPGTPNNDYWAVARNPNGTSEGILQTFATPRLGP